MTLHCPARRACPQEPQHCGFPPGLCVQEEQHLQLDVQPAVGRALKAHRFQLWMKTLPQEIPELMEAKEKHTEQ